MCCHLLHRFLKLASGCFKISEVIVDSCTVQSEGLGLFSQTCQSKPRMCRREQLCDFECSESTPNHSRSKASNDGFLAELMEHKSSLRTYQAIRRQKDRPSTSSCRTVHNLHLLLPFDRLLRKCKRRALRYFLYSRRVGLQTVS